MTSGWFLAVFLVAPGLVLSVASFVAGVMKARREELEEVEEWR